MSAVLDKEPPKTASLAELRNPGAPESRMPAVRMGFGDLQGFELMQRAAKALAASTLVPAQFQGNLPNCIIALEMANRIGASPLMVVQNLYVVHGRPGWSAKFLIASFNQCGRFTSLRYAWQAKPGVDEWGCRAWATEKATGEKIEGPLITIALAKKEGWYAKSGSKWQTIPELMLTYRAAAWLINTHAPEISMGLNTADEIGDVFDAAPAGDGTYAVTTDALRQVNKDTGVIEADPPATSMTGGDDPTQEIPGAGDESGAPEVTLAKLLPRLQTGTDLAALDADASLIGELKDFDERNRATDAYQKRRNELADAQVKRGGKK